MHRIEQTIFIAAPRPVVWQALTDPGAMRAWMGEPEMRIAMQADWRPGGTIVVSGLHHGAFRNTGTVLACVPATTLAYTHLSSVSGLPDLPEHHSVIAFDLMDADGGTTLRLVVEQFPTEIIFRHLNLYWRGTLDVFKTFVESSFLR